jgi:transcriptional regulator with XRE-family HTH domain
MTEVAQLVATVKKELKRRGFTYRDVARALGLSEPGVKRIFASGRFTLARLAQISDLLGLTLAELARESEAAAPRLRTLTLAQEKQLVSDSKLLLTAVCALNGWSLPDITAQYRLTEPECVKRLLLLDRMGLIELRPGNRVRSKVARDFDWLPDGPIRQFFRTQGQDFLDAPFDGAAESLLFVQGMLSDQARAHLESDLRRLRGRLSALHEESVSTPLDQKRGIAMLLAMRQWEPAGFRALRRSRSGGA